MRFRVERDELTDAVTWVARTLPTRPTTQLQVLAGLLLETSDTGLRLSAFDYEVAAWGEINASVVEEGRALVSGRLLAEIVRALPAAPVEFDDRAHPSRPDLRQQPVHAADAAGRGLPGAAGAARRHRPARQQRVRLGGLAGRDRRRP